MWGKQQKVESLIDPDDVAAGNRTFMRWRDRNAWVRSDEPTHEPLVTEEVFEAAQLEFAAKRRPAARRGRNAQTSDRFSLRGLICCGICGSRMQAAFRESKRKDGTGRTFYRCVIQRARALPEDFDHPRSVYVRQEPIVAQLNDWIGTLADPASLAAGQDDDSAAAAAAADLRRSIREVETKLANLVSSIEAGIDPTAIAPQMAARTAERNELQSRLRALTSAKRASAQQIQDELDFFGGIAPMLAKATPGELLDIYSSMQLQLVYQPGSKTVKAQVTPGACENVRVRGGT